MGTNFRITTPPTFFFCPPTFFDEFRYAKWNLIPQWRSDGAYYVSRAGRVHERGKALNEDLRRNIIQDHVEEKGGDLVSGYFPGSFSEIALKNRPIYNTVRKIWKQFLKLIARVMKATPPDQNNSNRMISISSIFENFSSIYCHG